MDAVLECSVMVTRRVGGLLSTAHGTADISRHQRLKLPIAKTYTREGYGTVVPGHGIIEASPLQCLLTYFVE